MANHDVVKECGCCEDGDLGIMVRTCPTHDTRTPRTRIAALFQELALHLDGADLQQAAVTCVKLSRAVLGSTAPGME